MENKPLLKEIKQLQILGFKSFHDIFFSCILINKITFYPALFLCAFSPQTSTVLRCKKISNPYTVQESIISKYLIFYYQSLMAKT